MTTIIIAIVFLSLLPDIHIWYVALRAGMPVILPAILSLPTLALLLLAAAAAAGHPHSDTFRIFFVLLLGFVLPKLIFAILSLTGRAAAIAIPAIAHKGDTLALTAALIVAATALYGYLSGWRRLCVREVEISLPRLPAAFDGYRAVHISDLHLGTYGSDTSYVSRLVERVNSLDPDVILFTGDLVNISAAETEPYRTILARLNAPDGVISVLGNHDYCEYGRYDTRDGARRNLEEVIRCERGMGWNLLLDGSVTLHRGADSIAVIGVQNTGRPPFPSRGNLRRAMQRLPDGIFKILLTHDPSHWRLEVLPRTDIDLTLSGHTHAVQLRIGGFSPARWLYPEWGGLYTDHGRALHVSTGIGGTVPFRLGAWPEIDIITLRRHSGQ